jgi:hypothetical protein
MELAKPITDNLIKQLKAVDEVPTMEGIIREETVVGKTAREE